MKGQKFYVEVTILSLMPLNSIIYTVVSDA